VRINANASSSSAGLPARSPAPGRLGLPALDILRDEHAGAADARPISGSSSDTAPGSIPDIGSSRSRSGGSCSTARARPPAGGIPRENLRSDRRHGA